MERFSRRAGSSTRDRLVHAALREAARHEAAIRACLAELDGWDDAAVELRGTLYRRAIHHLERTRSLVTLAARMNRDSGNLSMLAATKERQERAALLLREHARAQPNVTAAR